MCACVCICPHTSVFVCLQSAPIKQQVCVCFCECLVSPIFHHSIVSGPRAHSSAMCTHRLRYKLAAVRRSCVGCARWSSVGHALAFSGYGGKNCRSIDVGRYYAVVSRFFGKKSEKNRFCKNGACRYYGRSIDRTSILRRKICFREKTRTNGACRYYGRSIDRTSILLRKICFREKHP
jgi:hypothetical protein